MVKIVKAGMEKEVALSAYNNYYKGFGWKLSDKELIPMNDEDSEEVWDEVMNEEKDLSEMTKHELVQKAAEMGIDVSDLQTNKQIRERLRSYM